MMKLKLQYFGHLMQRVDSLEKTLLLGKIEGKKLKGAVEDEMNLKIFSVSTYDPGPELLQYL